MSKINTLRFVNLNYNNNAIHVDDETFRFDGKSTLMSLRNGGGKSVLVQMMIAPFVRKRYRNTEDRSFNSFFMTNKPTFIMVEWALDGNMGYALTGMMVRKSQSNGESDEKDDLEIINFVSEYKDKCKWDINHLAIIEASKTHKALKGFSFCRQLFETLKKDDKADFNYYDMNNSQQSRRYFEKLKEYQIDYKEWEAIIKKINLKESGLSDLFKEAKDEKGLIEKWFLDAVENKLNKEKQRIKEFEGLVLKYIRQYKENQSKILRKDTILKFNEEAIPVWECAEVYQGAAKVQRGYENRIANLMAIYQGLQEEMERQQETSEMVIREIEEALARLEHEEMSLQIYQLEDEKELLLKDCESNKQKQEQVSRECRDIERRLHILECAKCYEEYRTASEELQLYENRIEIAKKNETELEPERNRIGYNLRCRYEALKNRASESIAVLEEQVDRYTAEEKKLKGGIKDKQSKKERINLRQGGLQQTIKNYGKVEAAYNAKFQEHLVRNILGEYEVDALELLNQQYIQILQQNLRRLTDSKKKKETCEEEKRRQQKQLEEGQRVSVVLSEALKNFTRELEGYEKELKERITMIKYVDLPESDAFDREKILQAFDRKIEETQLHRNVLQRETDKLDKDCNMLKQGTVLELPKDFQEALSASGIHYVYGMKWLEKNGRSTADNERLVDQNPFIPYAIILGSKEFEKLRTQHLELYTSFPIPIVKRADLERVYEGEGTCLAGFEKVSFFVMFNKNLLDVDKLTLLIQEKELQLCKKQEQLQRKEVELDAYRAKRASIIHQAVSREIYDRCTRELERTVSEKKSVEIQIDVMLKEQMDTAKAYDDLLETIRMLEYDNVKGQERIGEFGVVCESYLAYQESRVELYQLDVELEDIDNALAKADTELEGILSSHQETIQSRESQKLQYQTIAGKVREFIRYSETELLNKDAEDLEARYQAITEQISNDMKQLEEQLQSAKKRYDKYESQLIKKADKYCLAQPEYDQISYDSFAESQLEKELNTTQDARQELVDAFHIIDKQITRLEENIKNQMALMLKQCGRAETVARAHITDAPFKRLMLIKKQEKKAENEHLEGIKEQLLSYKTSLSVFSEYSEFELLETVEFKEDFAAMKGKELSDYNGTVGRDYRQSIQEMNKAQGRLRDELNRISRIEEFEDDFYRKPIEMLMALIEDATGFTLQLDTVLDSYQSLMEKLAVDIAYIEKEKEQVNELLLDYMKEVHKNLEKIDKNSTINIRGRTIKMLKLILPNWEENEELYAVRMRDFMEQLTDKVLAAIDHNENIEELTGKHVTTKNLYNEVVGIGNIEVKLYKIEEQREYPITWAEVSRNSGGEGFLSAFVILSSLLYYMRRGDTDLFADKEEGKVLVMDNPFAQTNSAHLLKPLMDIANKTNTQLICLTGLGGDSIYSRFDNIYVMNLISSSLRKDMQYMKTEHIKGVDEGQEDMVLSRMKIEDEVLGEYEQGKLF